MAFPEPPTEYDMGDAPLLTGEFRARLTDVLTNPSVVTVKVKTPSGTTTTYTSASSPAVVHVSTGVYTLQLPALTEVGDWFYRFVGIGDLVDAADARFTIRASTFATAIIPSASQWVSGQSLVGEPRLDDANMPPGITFDMCAEAATDFLYARSGRRFRLHDAVVRPNQSGWCGSDGTEIDLPSPVVAGSVVVTIDGVVLSTSAYKLYDGHLLVRTDGDFWPLSSSLSSPSGTDWSIAFTVGEAPWMSGVLACRELAIHVALALSGKPSKIPARATSLSRGGVSINLMRGSKTGIALVDDFLQSANPHNLMGRGSVVSPDTVRLLST